MRPLEGVEIFILAVFCVGALAAPMIVLWVLQSQRIRRSPRQERLLRQRVAELEAENQHIREELYRSREDEERIP